MKSNYYLVGMSMCFNRKSRMFFQIFNEDFHIEVSGSVVPVSYFSTTFDNSSALKRKKLRLKLLFACLIRVGPDKFLPLTPALKNIIRKYQRFGTDAFLLSKGQDVYK